MVAQAPLAFDISLWNLAPKKSDMTNRALDQEERVVAAVRRAMRLIENLREAAAVLIAPSKPAG